MKKILQNILLTLFSIVIGLLMMEGIVRIAFGEKLALFPRYVSDVQYEDFKIRGNIPGSRYKHKSADGTWKFRINKNGFRSDEDYSYEKPNDVKRILVLGDSFTFGFEVDLEETFGSVLESYLQEKGIKVEVINAGVSGFGTSEELVFFENEGIKYNPDVVILGFFVNDYHNNIMADLYGMEDDKVVVNSKEYLPAIKTRNMLNSFSTYRWLSGNSYLMGFIRNVLSAKIQGSIREKNTKEIEKNLDGAGDTEFEELKDHVFKLTNALLVRMKEATHEIGGKFIILDIATKDNKNSVRLHSNYTASDLADEIVYSTNLISNYKGDDYLYRPAGHGHWTPITHKMSGEALGELLYEMFTEPELATVDSTAVE